MHDDAADRLIMHDDVRSTYVMVASNADGSGARRSLPPTNDGRAEMTGIASGLLAQQTVGVSYMDTVAHC